MDSIMQVLLAARSMSLWLLIRAYRLGRDIYYRGFCRYHCARICYAGARADQRSKVASLAAALKNMFSWHPAIRAKVTFRYKEKDEAKK